MQDSPARVLVVMGVAGSGKTTVARLLAQRLGWAYQEGDDLHSPENVAKMRAGTPLTDEDRDPWLHAIAAVIDGWLAAGTPGVVTCSALKRRYRDTLREATARVRFVQLDIDQSLVADRLAERRGHYMPPSLLDSQFAAFEPLEEDEDGVHVSVDKTPDAVAAEALRRLDLVRG